MATLKDNLVMGPSRVIGDAFFGGVVMPTITETQDIGSSTMKWRYIYAKEIMGNIDPDKVLGDGLVAIASGGTNSGSQTSNRINWFNGTGIVSAANVWTDGSKITVNGTAAPSGSTKFEVLGNTRISSSQSGAGGDISLELWRGTAASWKFLNTSGTLKLQNNYTTSAGSYFDVLTAAYNTGHITVTKGSVYPLDGNTTQSLGKDNARWDIYATNVDSGTIYVEGAAQFDGAIMAQSTLRVTGASTFIGAATFNNNTTTTGVATFNGNVQMNSSVSADSLTAGSLLVNGNTSLVNNTSSGHILPHATGTYDIGSSALKYREIYAGAMYATQFYGNATTATGWKSNLSLTIGNKTIAFNGDEGSVTYTLADIGVSDSGHTHTKIVTEGDNRSTATTPNQYANDIRFRGIKRSDAIGVPTTDTFVYLVGLRGWTNTSGPKSHEFAFHDNGISWRHGVNTSWDAWYDLVYAPNKTAVGSVKHPVYVDAYGQVKACNNATATSTQYLEAVSAAGSIGFYSNGSNAIGIHLIDKAGSSYYPFRFSTTGSSMPNVGVYTNIMFNDGREPYLYGNSGWSGSARAWFSSTAYTGAVPTGTDTQLVMLSANRGYIQYNFPYQQNNYTDGTLDTSTVVGNNSFFFFQYSYNASTSARLSYYDYFYLPKTAAGKTGNNGYAILTSKNDVTVSQGGTGRSSWTANHFVYSSGTTTLENTANITTDGNTIDISASYYPQFTLTASTAYSDTFSRATFQGDYSDNVAMWIYSDKTTSAKSRRGLVVYGYKSKSTADEALALRQCNTSGSWQTDLVILHDGNWHKRIFGNKNLTRSTLTITSSSWNVVPSGCVDVFGVAFKDTGLSTDTGDWRMWLAQPTSGQTTLNMRIDGTFQASEFIGNATSATKATQDGNGSTISSTYVTLSTDQTITGTKTFTGNILIGASGAGGIIYGNATNGGLNSMRIGDDVYLGDCNVGGILGLKSTASACGFYFHNSSGAQIGQFYISDGYYHMNKPVEIQCYGSSWLDGLIGYRSIQYTDATNTGSYWPWGSQTNTASARFFSFGTLNTSFYWIGSTSGRAENGYDHGLQFDISNGYLQGAQRVYSAVWNDFAEMRETDETEAGRVVARKKSSELMSRTTERLQGGARIISDTYGQIVGQSDTAKTPIGVAGRVLVYPYQNKNNYKIGDAVCAAPNGTADIMTREEVMLYPDRIIGIVDEIPDYDTWSQTLTNDSGKKTVSSVKVKGRIWIYVK